MTVEEQARWISEFQGKTLRRVHSKRDSGDPVPYVHVEFDDGSKYEVCIKRDLFFEGCLYNILRKAQPVERIQFIKRGTRTIVEIRAHTFPLFVLRAVDKEGRHEFPFTLIKLKDGEDA